MTLPFALPTSTPGTGFCDIVVTAQLSVAVNCGMLFGTSVSQPLTVMLAGQFVITGEMASFTVTVDTQVLWLPAPSITVSVRLLSPRLVQLNTFFVYRKCDETVTAEPKMPSTVF